MNRVGIEGRGESVWVAWFLISGLKAFLPLSEDRDDAHRAAAFREAAEGLRRSVERSGWDGSWYRRATFDDGTPLGSAQNDECRIDSIAQTWAVLSGAADSDRAGWALAEVDRQLVRVDDGVILLFAPPFDSGSLQPGYVKGYVPGIRENGGQYTHAAIWVVQAAARLGRGTRAHELFDLINPVRRADGPAGVDRYKVEPYVVAADVYGRPPHIGRGGWTWYTGSAAWLYRVAIEDILGLKLRGDRLVIEPSIPAAWPGFSITYRRRASTYRVVVENPLGVEHGVAEVTLDGQPFGPEGVPLADDGGTHEIRVRLGLTGQESGGQG